MKKTIVIVVVIILFATPWVIYLNKRGLPFQNTLVDQPKLVATEINSKQAVVGSVSTEMMSWIEKSYSSDSIGVLVPIKKTGKIYIPAVGMMESLSKAGDINKYGETKSSDIASGTHMALITQPDGKELAQPAAYTDLMFLNNKEVVKEHNAHDWFISVLNMEDSDGMVINPKTRFMQSGFSPILFSTNRYGVAEITGLMEINELPKGTPFHQLANEAFAKGEYYKVLFYWGASYRIPRAGDDWKLAEASKLRAYFILNFPGSRERARTELQWMMKNHQQPDIEPLMAEFNSPGK